MSIWAAVDRLVDDATDEAGIRAHGLDVWAARRWMTTGRSVPSGLLLHERAAVMATLSVPSQLAWIRQVLDGPIVLLKGPEVAARYPDPALRPFGDLDLLVPNPEEAQARLIAAGCIEIAELPPHHHHLPTLQCPGWLVSIEIHSRPNGPAWSAIPTDELFAMAVPSALPIDGIMTVPPAHHAVLLAAHSWRHAPIGQLVDLVDIAAMSEGLDRDELQALADKWNLGHVWKTTQSAIDAVCTGTPPEAGTWRCLGGHLWDVRKRSPMEVMVAGLAATFWAPKSLTGFREVAKTVFRLPRVIARRATIN